MKSHITSTLKNLTLTTPVSILLGACIIAVGLVGYGLVTRTSTPAVATTAFKGRAIDDTDYVEGVNKKVFFVEYSDTECPYCVSFHAAAKQIRNEYAGKIGFVYRTFPLTSIHPHAQKEAEALMCAGKLGGAKAYNSMMTAMFDYKVENNTPLLPSDGFETLGNQAGVDGKAVAACAASGEMTDKVNASVNDGIAAGVTGTPTSFVLVKGKKGYQVVAGIEGSRPYAFVKQAIDQALAE